MLLPLSSVSSCDCGCRLLMALLLLLLLLLVGLVDWLRERQYLKNYRVSVIKNVISAFLRPLAARSTLALVTIVEKSYGFTAAAAAACPSASSSASSSSRAVVGGSGLIGIFAVAVALRDNGTLSSVRGGAKQPCLSLARRRTPREAA